MKKMTYKDAGVDVEKEEKAIKSILKSINKQRKRTGILSGKYAGEIVLIYNTK